MKPARKTRDFSIESILADKREKSCDVRTECHVTNFECTTNAVSETENCGANFRSEIRYENSERNFECGNENKCDMKCIVDAESDFRNKIEEGNGKCNENILESSEQELIKSNADTTVIIRNIEDECEINSKSFEHEKFDATENYCKTISLRRDQEKKLNEERKSKGEQSDQFYDSKYLNSDFAGNRCKNSRDLNSSCETESKYSFKNENKKTEFSRSKTGTPEVLRDIEKLEWLQCTRYKPPKIPRKPIGKNKRKPSFYPRIPFSMFQLEFLEQKFRNSAYLTRNDVIDISDILKLPPNRVYL
nr:PREDICTED: uncharacterized protein LOC105663661 [Megachile rotundata]